jgi:hypothetical protein
MPLRHRLPLHPRVPLHLLTTKPTREQPSHRSVTDIATREQLLARARRLGVFTVAWNALEGFVAISAAWIAGSRALARSASTAPSNPSRRRCCPLAPWRGAPRSRPRRTRGARRHPSDRGELPVVGLTRSRGSVSSPCLSTRAAKRSTPNTSTIAAEPPPDRPQPRLGDPERSWHPSTRDSPARQPSPIGAIRQSTVPPSTGNTSSR